MLSQPRIQFHLKKIEENAARLKALCDSCGIEPIFVTKGFHASKEIINAVMEIGITRFADSRLQNVAQAKGNHPDMYYLLIRPTTPAEAEDVVQWADASMQSEIQSIRAISDAALAAGKVHQLYLAIDVGDLREGIFSQEQLDEIAPQILECKGVELVGLAMNIGCYGSVLPSAENTQRMVDVKHYLNETYGFHITQVNVGGTVVLPLLEDGTIPSEVSEIRIGEAILFGEDTTGNRDLEGYHKDAIIFSAPIIEMKRKPSVPIGNIGRDSCGNVIEYEDRGVHMRALCAAGKQDVDVKALTPVDPRITIIGNSSDHLIIDVEECYSELHMGDYVEFRCSYMAMLAAVTSPYVEKTIEF